MSSEERRQQAVALVVNDYPPTRRRVTNRLYMTGIGKVESPRTFEEFRTTLAGAVSSSAAKFNLIILDYELGNWAGTFDGRMRDVTFADVVPIIQDSLRTQGAHITILTAHPERARKDPLCPSKDVIDDETSSPDTFEDIVNMHIG